MKKIIFLFVIFGFLNNLYSFPQIKTKTIFENKKISFSLVSLKTEINGLKFYDIDCVSCFEEAIKISRIAFSKFCKEVFPTQKKCWADFEKKDNLTIIFVSPSTINQIRKYFSMPISSNIITNGLYDYNSRTIFITIFSDNYYYFNYLTVLLHELAHYYFDIYNLSQNKEIEHYYINLYLDLIFKNYLKILLLDVLNDK